MKEFIGCCGVIKSTADENCSIDCYKSNPKTGKFFKKFTSEGQEIKKEILLVTYCINCKHYVLKFLWYLKNSAGFFDYAEAKIIRGKEADRIFQERIDGLSFYPLPKEKKTAGNFLKQSKKIPWTYYKSLNGETQIKRYIDESGNAGKKIYAPVKMVKS